MVERSRFEIVPALRCWATVEGSPGGVCGERARWMGCMGEVGLLGFYCDGHKPGMAQPIAKVVELRRVHLTVETFFAATSNAPSLAHTEAYERLDREVRRVGGVMGLINVTSGLGQGEPPAPPMFTPRRRDGAE